MKLTDMLKGLTKFGGNDPINQTAEAGKTKTAQGLESQEVQNAPPAEGLAKTASADLAEKVKTTAAIVAQIKPKYTAGTGQVGELVSKAIDFSEAQAAWWSTPQNQASPGEAEILGGKIETAKRQLSTQLATAAGEGHHGKAPSEIAERQVYAKAFAGELTQRVMEEIPLDVAFRSIPGLANALAPANAEQKEALAFQTHIGELGAAVSKTLGFIESATEKGFKLDMGEKKAMAAARSNVGVDPESAIKSLIPTL